MNRNRMIALGVAGLVAGGVAYVALSGAPGGNAVASKPNEPNAPDVVVSGVSNTIPKATVRRMAGGRRRGVACIQLQTPGTYRLYLRREGDGAAAAAIEQSLPKAATDANKCGVLSIAYHVGLRSPPRGGPNIPGMTGAKLAWSQNGHAKWREVEVSTPGVYRIALDGPTGRATGPAWTVPSGLDANTVGLLRLRLKVGLAPVPVEEMP